MEGKNALLDLRQYEAEQERLLKSKKEQGIKHIKSVQQECEEQLKTLSADALEKRVLLIKKSEEMALAEAEVHISHYEKEKKSLERLYAKNLEAASKAVFSEIFK